MVWGCAAAWAGIAGRADVVINEGMYRPPDNRDELQFIELANAGPAPVELSSWSFSKGVKFTFPAGTTLPPGGFAVVCREAAAFAQAYPLVTPVGAFEGRLKHGGERLELCDAAGKVRDSVKFTDRPPGR